MPLVLNQPIAGAPITHRYIAGFRAVGLMPGESPVIVLDVVEGYPSEGAPGGFVVVSRFPRTLDSVASAALITANQSTYAAMKDVLYGVLQADAAGVVE